MSLETILNSFLNRESNTRRLFPSYLSSHSIHVFNCLQTEMKRLKCLDLKNFLAYNTLCKELKISLKLDTILFINNFSSSNCDMNDCYRLLNILKSSDGSETMINRKKQTVCGSDFIGNAFNQFFASV